MTQDELFTEREQTQHIEASKCPRCGTQWLGWYDNPDTRNTQSADPISRPCWQCENLSKPPSQGEEFGEEEEYV